MDRGNIYFQIIQLKEESGEKVKELVGQLKIKMISNRKKEIFEFITFIYFIYIFILINYYFISFDLLLKIIDNFNNKILKI